MGKDDQGKPRGVLLNVQSAHLLAAWDEMPHKEQVQVVRMHRFYERETRRANKATANLEGAAAGLHDAIDRAVEHTRELNAWQVPHIPCKKGCAHCCHTHVSITRPEAVLLLKFAQGTGVAIDWQRVERQAPAGLVGWHAQPREDWRCVFLADDNTCTVYEHRPGMCRKHAVIGGSEQCDSDKHPGGKVLNFVSMHAEVIQSAVMATTQWGSLPAMLLQEKERGK